ncbi:MAG TPA: ABC transporter permease [Geminicoccaceae bacterium]|nr:ABC transporter permease [Geminicoccaceae bacterium]
MTEARRRPEPVAPERPGRALDSTFGTPFDLNLIGLRTLYLKEVRRFLKVPGQTLAAPVVTTLMFLLIFSLALGRSGRVIGTVPFLEFLAPGLIMMAIIQNAFANTSSSLLIGKIQGNIVDILMPPLRPAELMFGLVAGGVTRGLLVAVVVALAMVPFVDVRPHDPLLIVYYALAGSLMLALLGLLGGLWAEKFDQMAAVTNFLITPLSFLSGTFYSIAQLPELFQAIAHANPFFYLIDGIRFGFTGHADGSLLVGAGVVLLVDVALWWLAQSLIARGWRLKA